MRVSVLLLASALSLPLAACGQSSSAPREYGRVPWARGYDAAAKTARREHKPLLVLFQEVPG